jgi:hypothetical protein
MGHVFTPSLQAAATAGADVTVHVTGATAAAAASEVELAASNNKTNTMKDDDISNTSSATSASPPGGSHAAPAHSVGGNVRGNSFGETPLKRRFWRPSSPLYAWFVGAIMLYASTLGSITGYLAGHSVS